MNTPRTTEEKRLFELLDIPHFHKTDDVFREIHTLAPIVFKNKEAEIVTERTARLEAEKEVERLTNENGMLRIIGAVEDIEGIKAQLSVAQKERDEALAELRKAKEALEELKELGEGNCNPRWVASCAKEALSSIKKVLSENLSRQSEKEK